MAGRKKTTKKSGLKSSKKKSTVKSDLSPRKQKRGLGKDEIIVSLNEPSIENLAAEVANVGGAAIGAYREPLSGRPILLAVIPLTAVQPTPFQRDLSPTHTKRLAQKIEQSGSFLDPLIVVRGEDGRLWTPNGRHRLAAAKVLGLKQITVLISPDEDLAFRILALNTEKAHNLKDRSLEVIRMARNLALRKPRAKESQFQAEFESSELLTLGIIYDSNKRFGGGAYSPFLKKVDRFLDRSLPVSIRQREDFAARLLDIDANVKRVIEKLQSKGFKSPYMRNYVVARINPVRFHRAKKGDSTPPMSLASALTRMAGAIKKFDINSVNPGEIAIVAAMSSSSD